MIAVFVLMLHSSTGQNVARSWRDAVIDPAARQSLERFCMRLADTERASIAVLDLGDMTIAAMSGADGLARVKRLPGSVFKIVTSLAALTSGTRLPDPFLCTGVVVLHGREIRCWLPSGHGELTFEAAFANSCNCYFAALGDQIGGAALLRTAEKLGFGRKTMFDVPGESPGTLPRALEATEVPLFAIGQHPACRVTGLQLLQVSSLFARDAGFSNSLSRSARPLKVLRDLMRGVVRSGTGRKGDVHGFPVAGKSGTIAREIPWKYDGWFTCFAPFDDPKVAVVVFAREGSGSDRAAPVAGKVMQYLSRIVQ